MKEEASKEAWERGLIEKTSAWEKRWGDKYKRLSTGTLVKLG
eukprot:CAMPEP_0195523598 /NCGR_PEP_ID=MMETSP0794_2-20130614/22863_1 /TAXON_ID=515487 /ORGANISM="Stephanopyxis turris, Strain CCMP 815" /LENGTH=41 /DNA_ID= /DNA_START= /DNA_END= /DNA_ORIENTATION=